MDCSSLDCRQLSLFWHTGNTHRYHTHILTHRSSFIWATYSRHNWESLNIPQMFPERYDLNFWKVRLEQRRRTLLRACPPPHWSSCLEGEEPFQMPGHHLACAWVKYHFLKKCTFLPSAHNHLHSILSSLCGLELTVLSLRTITQAALAVDTVTQVALAPPLLQVLPHVSSTQY